MTTEKPILFKAEDYEQPETACQKCGLAIPDFDGFGVLSHIHGDNPCGYCSHPALDGNVCDICGHEVSNSRG